MRRGNEAARIALAQVGVREQGRNRGPEVDTYVWAVGLKPSGRHPWCMAFVYWVHLQAALALNAGTTCPRTAGAVKSWAMAGKAGGLRFAPAHVAQGMVKLCPGDQFVRVRRGAVDEVADARAGRIRKGHTGLIYAVDGTTIETIEGNTNVEGSREGDGVYRKTLDVHMPELVGFVRHTACAVG